MAKIVFVETYPYESFFGGDAEYVISLASHFVDQGHDVHFVVSDMQRGRTAPFYISPYPINRFASYNVRNAIKFRNCVLSTDALGFGLKFAKKIASGNKQPDLSSDETCGGAELDWIRSQVEHKADVIILCFDATKLSSMFVGSNALVIALPSIIPGRMLGLDSSEQAKSQNAIPDFKIREFSSSNIIAATNDDDASALRSVFPEKDILVVKTGAHFRAKKFNPTATDVIFVGNNTGPNSDGINWFIREMWPAVVRGNKSARLRVVGKVAEAVKNVSENVDLVGRVSDISAEYERAAMAISPLRNGTVSIKIKVAEAITYGCPIVTTSVGVDPSAPHQFDEAGFVTDNPHEFASYVSRLLSDSELRLSKTEGARLVHEKYFSKTASYSEIDSRIQALRPNVNAVVNSQHR